MHLAPLPNIGPVEVVASHGDDVTNIVAVFTAARVPVTVSNEPCGSRWRLPGSAAASLANEAGPICTRKSASRVARGMPWKFDASEPTIMNEMSARSRASITATAASSAVMSVRRR